MILTSSIIPCIVLYGSLTFILESPRFLIINNKFEESILVIN